jgi:phosphotransferase system HPr-like phosphotransfer protein
MRGSGMSVKFPVIPAQRTLKDAQKALENIRDYFTALSNEPASSALTWDGKQTTGIIGLAIDSTKCVTVTIDGKTVKLGVVK